MEASPAGVIQYFNGEKQNIIPLFQRPYSWKKVNWQALWDDILVQYDAEDRSTHFMGTIVSVPARSVPVGVSKYLIIDGQQRLTTISLFLAALRDSVDEVTSARIQEVYLTNRFRSAEDTLKFVPTQIDRDVYKSIVLDRHIVDDQNLMSEAYSFFKTKLNQGFDLDGNPVDVQRILTTLEHSLQVVMINLGDEDDPYLIFESLNFKGQPLTQADLVRNYLLMRFRHSMAAGGEQERIYVQYWVPMEGRLNENLTEFLRHYAMKEGENIYQKGIYSATKAKLRSMSVSEEVESEISKMNKFSIYYAKILEPNLESNAKIRKKLQNLKELDVGTSYPLLLRLMDVRESGIIDVVALEKCLNLIESFVIRRAVAGLPTNALNKLFLQWARQFPAEAHEAWLLTSMSAGAGGRRFPGDAEFKDSFCRLPQYGRGSTRFILCALEESFAHREPADLSQATIEHVMPQTITDAWQQALGPSARDIHAKYIDTIGNLTLTGYNSNLSNLPFEEKKRLMQSTHIELNRSIIEKISWNEEDITDRAEKLSRIALERWPGPPPNVFE
ncbi:DUF262 domain-containing protein [Xanthobacter sp. VNH20]|uniref:DUF262 domain-containing protein n=1 Tax=Xanthobacter sp. VNH20 TaxID=3156616 RepID=UPI0032B5B0FA